MTEAARSCVPLDRLQGAASSIIAEVTDAEASYVTAGAGVRRILTSNREPKDLYALLPRPVLAEGLLDRLLNGAHVITMHGRSYRPKQRPGTPPNGASTER